MLVDYPGDGDTVTVGRTTYDVEDGTVDLDSEAHLRTVARRHGIHPAEISHAHCDERLSSGAREGELCGRTLPCQHHSEDD